MVTNLYQIIKMVGISLFSFFLYFYFPHATLRCHICENIIKGKTKNEQNCYQCLYCKIITHRSCWTEQMQICPKSPQPSLSSPSSTSSSLPSDPSSHPPSVTPANGVISENKLFSLTSKKKKVKNPNKSKVSQTIVFLPSLIILSLSSSSLFTNLLQVKTN